MKGNFEGMTNEQLTIYERSKQLRVKVNSVITFPGMCFLSLSLSRSSYSICLFPRFYAICCLTFRNKIEWEKSVLLKSHASVIVPPAKRWENNGFFHLLKVSINVSYKKNFAFQFSSICFSIEVILCFFCPFGSCLTLDFSIIRTNDTSFLFSFFFHHMQSNVYVHLTNHFFVLRNCVQFRLCMQKWIIFFPLYRRYFCKSCIFSKLQRKNTKCFNIFFNLRIASGGGTCNTSYQQWHEFQKHTTIT